jgi:hypothetical protein
MTSYNVRVNGIPVYKIDIPQPTIEGIIIDLVEA